MQLTYLTLVTLLNLSTLSSAYSCMDTPSECKWGIKDSTWIPNACLNGQCGPKKKGHHCCKVVTHDKKLAGEPTLEERRSIASQDNLVGSISRWWQIKTALQFRDGRRCTQRLLLLFHNRGLARWGQ
ncbi:hypothetical protein FKW77_003259 [Venturia effusa]|uniref:CBM1 domain-containing protein n=1 Tax=Venturia effusa TaxID=50376 RepID=A0A517LMI2_9PEZI|nr:hypothetical protein FKW77_003259 [Venturia effusa]